MKRLYFLEVYEAGIDPKEAEIISFDPMASYELSKNMVAYKIPEDYYSEKELASFGENFFSEQLDWFASLDRFIKDNILYCQKYNISLCESNYLRLKYVVDTAIIHSYIIDSILKKLRGVGELIFIHKPFNISVQPSPFLFKSKSRELFFDILKMFCKKYNIKFVDVAAERSEPTAGRSAGIAGFFKKNKFIKGQSKKISTFFKYNKFSKFFSPGSFPTGKNMLIMHAGSLWMDNPIREFIKKGAKVYLPEKEYFVREDEFRRSAVALPVLEDSFLNRLREECKDCSNKLKPSRLLSWINGKVSIEIDGLIEPFFRYFILEDCYSILLDAEKTRRFCNANDIGYVFARANTEKNSVGPVISAKYCGGAKSICVQHACFTQDLGTVGMMDTAAYDYVLTADRIAQDFYSDFLDKRGNPGCKPVFSGHYLREVSKNYRHRARKVKRERVVYAVSKFSEGVRCFNGVSYPLPWYYEFQKYLMDIFGNEKGVDFIYKHAPRTGQEWAEKTIMNYIEEKGYGNISVYSKHFLRALKLADRVIVDSPSATALFEAASALKPVLAIYPHFAGNILKEGRELFGKSLSPFTEFKETQEAVKRFLYADPSEYIVKMPLEGKEFIETFQKCINEI